MEGYSPLKGTNLADPVLVDIAKAYGVTTAQVVLRWHIEHGITVIPKSVNPERITANFDLMRLHAGAGPGRQDRYALPPLTSALAGLPSFVIMGMWPIDGLRVRGSLRHSW